MKSFAIVRPTKGSRPGFVERAAPDSDPTALVRAKSLRALANCVKGLTQEVDEPFGQRRPFWVVTVDTEEFIFLGYMAHRRAAMELVLKTPQFKSFDVIGYEDRRSIMDHFYLHWRNYSASELERDYENTWVTQTGDSQNNQN